MRLATGSDFYLGNFPEHLFFIFAVRFHRHLRLMQSA